MRADRCFRLHPFHILTLRNLCTKGSNTFTQIRTRIGSVRSKNDCFLYTIRKLVSDSVGTISVVSTVSNEITLNDTTNSGQIVEAGNKNLCNANSVAVIPQNVFNTIVNLDFLLVEHTFSAHKELTVLWISTKNYSRSTINLDANGRIGREPIKHRKITIQDGIFGVLKMFVLHLLSAHTIGTIWTIQVGIS